MKRIIMSTLIFLSFSYLCSSPAFVLSASIVKIGNPGLKQFSSEKYFARTIWDMHYYNGNIYIGMGDYWNNVGPIGIWSLGTDGSFRKDYTVDEQQVWYFREYDKKLLIPGVDATESWAYGNIYIKDDDTWQKLRTIPNGLHVTDAVIFEGKIYTIRASTENTAVLESSDKGQSWQPLVTGALGEFNRLAVLDDSLIIFATLKTANGWGSYIYRYRNGNLEKLTFPLFPGTDYNTPYRIVEFKNGILYIGLYTVHPVGSLLFVSPLFFLSDSDSGIIVTKMTWKESIRDIIVRDDICYVLTASETGDAFQGTIYSSSDLDNWTEVADFNVPALPYSFELLDGVFYVGLGFTKPQDGQAVIESGEIYKINLDESWPLWDLNRDGVTNISDLALLCQYFGKGATVNRRPDVNGDGEIDILDLIIVAEHFGRIYSPMAYSADVPSVGSQ